MLTRQFVFSADAREKASVEANIRIKTTKASREAKLRIVESQQFERGYN